jgi:hypothetical protein
MDAESVNSLESEAIFFLHSRLYALGSSINAPNRSALILAAKQIPQFLGKFGYSVDKSRK